MTERGPVTGKERIVAIDVLRGFALLGILVVNVQSFSMISAAYANPTAYGDLTGANFVVWLVTHVGFDQKFMTIFSMLFGAGIVLMTGRLERCTGKSAGVHYRRMFWLTLIGLAHGHLLWFGDILFFYGICGMLVYPLRKLRPRWQIAAGVLTISVASLLSLGSGASLPHWPDEARESFVADWQPGEDKVEQEVSIYRGGWLRQMDHRRPMALQFETFIFLFWGLWRAAGLMLVGMGLFQLGVFQAARSAAFYGRLIVAGVLLGLPLVLYGVRFNQQVAWDPTVSFFFGGQFNYWGSLPVSLAYVGAVMLAVRARLAAVLKAALAAVGRTALTNYLLQTVICTTIFYGHGLGLFGQVERVGQAGVVAAVWLLQLVVSPLWIARFRFGPAEWLWRALTYLQLPPMRRP